MDGTTSMSYIFPTTKPQSLSCIRLIHIVMGHHINELQDSFKYNVTQEKNLANRYKPTNSRRAFTRLGENKIFEIACKVVGLSPTKETFRIKKLHL